MDVFSKYNIIANTLRNQQCDLELVTTLTFADGSTQEITNTRRAVCRKATRKRNITVLEFADVDRSALDKLFPFETFTTADFPELFVDHVGRRIPQGVGTVVKVPMTWIKKTGGTWSFAGAKYTGSSTLLAVYRGTEVGRGSVVDPSEYTQSFATGASTGVQVDTVNFTREQSDFSGKPYIIEADFLLSGTRTGPSEISRILGLYGISVDGTFATASTADIAAGFLIDALYIERTGKAILEDLLRVSRGYLVQGAAGAWSIVQDVAKASSAQYDSAADLVEINGYGDGNTQKTITASYRPKMSGTEEYGGIMSRTVANGAAGEFPLHLPYVRDHVVADRLLSYWQKRFNTLRQANATIHAVQSNSGDRITVTDSVVWTGAKDFIITGVTRPGDKNEVVLREYDASIYTYTPGTLPADATNVYGPDYSFTPPAAPTGLTVVSQGTTSDTDGKTTAYALIRAVPPAVNWSLLMVQLQDTSTLELYQVQLRLNGGNYEATVSGLRPNRLHAVLCWAVNANNIAGATATIANITTANATTALAAPTVSVSQVQSFEVKVELGAVSNVAGQPGFLRNVLFESINGGAYAEVKRDASRTYIRSVTNGIPYAYIARSEDMNHNESGNSTAASITPQKSVDGTYIVDSSINQGRSFTGTGSGSVTVGAGSSQAIDMDIYTFFPDLDHGSSADECFVTTSGTKPGQADQGRFRLRNHTGAGSVGVNIDWRKFNA